MRTAHFESTHPFESFADMLDKLPAEWILKAIEIEHRMLEEDVLFNRVAETQDVDSILFFCKFINADADEDNILLVELPKAQVTFYGKIVMRLIDACEIYPDAMEKFHLAFSSGLIRTFARN